MSDGVRCMWMRGGTSRGGYFLAEDLPADTAARDAFLLRIMGSPDPRQIDGMGGSDPLTSKIAVVNKSEREGVDVDYLFLQVFVDQPIVTDSQNCGNILAGVGPFAIERGLVEAKDGTTDVRIFMVNTEQLAIATVSTPGGKVNYGGDASIDGVPGTSAPQPIIFEDTAGSTCGALLPTGNDSDTVEGVEVTMIDNGMPCVVMSAEDMGITGDETPEELEANDELRARLEKIRLACGPLMNLGDVAKKVVPKLRSVSSMVMPPARTGSDSSSRKAVIRTDHANSGILWSVMPGARMLKMVVMKLIAPRIEDAPAMCSDRIAKSMAGPGWPEVDSGG